MTDQKLTHLDEDRPTHILELISGMRRNPQVDDIVDIVTQGDGMSALIRTRDGNAYEIQVRQAANNQHPGLDRYTRKKSHAELTELKTKTLRDYYKKANLDLTSNSDKLAAQGKLDKRVDGAYKAYKKLAAKEDIQEIRKLAGLPPLSESDAVEKISVGHEDNEREMMGDDIKLICHYAQELMEMLDELPDNVDFPHWLQAKITTSLDAIDRVKHYLQTEIPEIRAEFAPTPDDFV